MTEGSSKFHAGFNGRNLTMQITSAMDIGAASADTRAAVRHAGDRLAAVPPLDARAAPIDVLAYVLADDELSRAAKIGMLEQWRYDLLQLQVGADEGLDCAQEDGSLLQLISKTLTRLAARRARH
jgi:hypothetical protein